MVHRTNESGSGSWPTPTASDMEGNGYRSGARSSEPKLAGAAKEWAEGWATPTAGDSKQSGVSEDARQRGYAGTLTDHVREWADSYPTPKARDMRGSQGAASELARHSPDLPTVAAELAVELGLLDARTGLAGGATSIKVDLNPSFDAALMGVPLNWLTPSTSVGTDSYRQWLHAHSLSSPLAPASICGAEP